MRRYLSPLEIAVLSGCAWGETARETAKRLERSHETVRTVRRRVVDKLGAKTMCHAVYIYFVTQGNPRPPA